MFVIGCLLTTSFVSIGSLAKNQQSITVITNKSLDEKLNGFLDSLNEKDILNPQLINIIRNKIIFNNYDGEIIPGTFIFTPCNPIDIEGIGIVDYDGSFGYLCLDEGTAELDNTFSRNYLKDEIGAICIFEEFEGEIIGEPEESSPLKVTGQSGLFILVEYSHLLAIYIDEMFYTGVEVPVIITNMIKPHCIL